MIYTAKEDKTHNTPYFYIPIYVNCPFCSAKLINSDEVAGEYCPNCYKIRCSNRAGIDHNYFVEFYYTHYSFNVCKYGDWIIYHRTDKDIILKTRMARMAAEGEDATGLFDISDPVALESVVEMMVLYS